MARRMTSKDEEDVGEEGEEEDGEEEEGGDS